MIVFSKQWFAKYNKQLCWLANSCLGQFVFKFKKFGHYYTNKIVRITPNSIDELVRIKDGKLELKVHFFERNEYALRLQKIFYPIWITFHTWDMLIANKFKPAWNLGFDTLTVYPVAGANSPVDGYTQRASVNETFATIREGAGTGFNNTGANTHMGILQSSATSSQYQRLDAGWFLFDTSALTSSATISNTTFSFAGNIKNDGLGQTPFHCAGGTTASNSTLANADHANRASTSFGNVAYADMAADGTYNDISLNASGISNVNKTGISTFTLQLGWDIANSFTGSWGSTVSTYFYGYYADQGSNKPKLVVTYTIAAADTGNFLQLF